MNTQDDITQPGSESYIHLSEDVSETISLDNARENTDQLCLLSRKLDMDNYFAKGSYSPSSKSNQQLPKFTSAKPSSHSTPLQNNNIASPFSKFLPQIIENTNNDILHDFHNTKDSLVHGENEPKRSNTINTKPKVANSTISNLFDQLAPSVGQQVLDSLKQVLQDLQLEQNKVLTSSNQDDNFNTPIKSNSTASPKLQDSPLTTPPDSNEQNYGKSFDQSYDNSYLNKKSKDYGKQEQVQYEAVTQSPFLNSTYKLKSPSPIANSPTIIGMQSRPSTTSTKVASSSSCDDKSSMKQLQKQIDELTKKSDALQLENINLHINLNNLHQQLLQKDDFEVETSNDKDLETIKLQNRQLELKLQRLNQGYQELKNEYNWFKQNNEPTTRADITNQHPQQTETEKEEKAEVQNTSEKIETCQEHSSDTFIAEPTIYTCKECESKETNIIMLRKQLQDMEERMTKEVGKKELLISENNIPEKFIKKYRQFELSKLDGKSKVELCNILKLIMLTLLISDVDNLESNMIKYATYLKISIPFLDQMHDLLYDSGDIKPSSYIRNHGGNDDDLQKLSQCLQGMLNTIQSA